jgi:hypothetical protein
METSCEGKNSECHHSDSSRFILLQVSGLVKAIFQWSEPGAMVTWKAKFAISLLRSHRIHETLMLILLSWIPKDIVNAWTNNPTALKMKKVLFYLFFNKIHLFWKQIKGMRSIGDKDMFNILKSNPDMVPRQAHPSSIFFMLSLANFQLAIKQWLGYMLCYLNYDVCLSPVASTLTDHTCRLISLITKWELKNYILLSCARSNNFISKTR